MKKFALAIALIGFIGTYTISNSSNFAKTEVSGDCEDKKNCKKCKDSKKSCAAKEKAAANKKSCKRSAKGKFCCASKKR